jgi:capsular exopolysaccharide synthesis family protein
VSRIGDALKLASSGHGEGKPEGAAVSRSPALERDGQISDRRAGDVAASTLFRVSPDAEAPLPELDPCKDGLMATTPGMLPIPTEQYRRLAAILYHAQNAKGMRIVMVTSAIGGEGKSLTTANLALTLARSYKRRVLLIDADLRRPVQQTVFGLPDAPGLNEHLRATGNTRVALRPVAERLFLLSAGHPDPDPVGSLTSERMRRVVAEGAERFDWVIVDTPPVALLPDAKLIADMTDGALLVVRAGHSPYGLIRNAIDALGQERILGVVLNGAEATQHGTKAYYGYYGPQKPR